VPFFRSIPIRRFLPQSILGNVTFFFFHYSPPLLGLLLAEEALRIVSFLPWYKFPGIKSPVHARFHRFSPTMKGIAPLGHSPDPPMESRLVSSFQSFFPTPHPPGHLTYSTLLGAHEGSLFLAQSVSIYLHLLYPFVRQYLSLMRHLPEICLASLVRSPLFFLQISPAAHAPRSPYVP